MTTRTVQRPPPETGKARRYATPTGEPCPYARRADGSVDGDGACRGCGNCLLGAGWEE
ncbi:hypothetical protein AMIS_29920 [Actinoplanes missouriensis 431]|uniref:Uncharacterized protein n=1 Tax=Actinoplanes missouriensis (strain ATCC 14538 / DSM 43046 / CBS 188.64 / JCM 3121 / NBRC 102363 / NCIMB 12654 / NRRL B-3342 / UNCC 431) TaxID=512565 RepID=I0H5C5_ACTM4|nr:hypothetical protein [Actinoplanes missouriensis]BAL88212.1 hypothetical protein AMIS_29920 [Actinoplanes missouriensis 431]